MTYRLAVVLGGRKSNQHVVALLAVGAVLATVAMLNDVLRREDHASPEKKGEEGATLQNKVARWRKPDFKIVCVWPFGLEGL